MFFSAVMLPAILLRYPLFWCGRQTYYPDAVFFGDAELMIVALAGIVQRCPWKLPDAFAGKVLSLLMLFTAVSGVRHFMHGMPATVLGECLYYPVLLLFGLLYREELKHLLPPFFIALGAADAFLLILDTARSLPPYGLCGNWNWSSALLYTALGAVLFSFRKLRFRELWLLIILLLTAAALCLPSGGKFFSWGALAGAMSALGVIAMRRVRGVKLLCSLSALAAVGIAGAILLWHHTMSALRLELFAAGWRAALNSFSFGTSPGGFDSAVSPLFSRGYFAMPEAAELHMHPHNEMLFNFASLGLAGIMLFLFVSWVLFRSWRDRERCENSFVLFFAVFMFLYGMIDMNLAVWPLGAVGYLCFGMLIPLPDAENAAEVRRQKFRTLLAVLLLAAALFSGGVNLLSCLFSRAGHLSRDPYEKMESYNRSLLLRPVPKTAYLAARNALYNLRSPEKALFYLDIIPALGVENYDRNHLVRAQALVLLGRREEAIHFFELAERNFPLSGNDRKLYLALKASLHGR